MSKMSTRSNNEDAEIEVSAAKGSKQSNAPKKAGTSQISGDADQCTWRSRVPPPSEFRKGDDINIYLFRVENWFRITRVSECEKTDILWSIIGGYAVSQIFNSGSLNVTECSYDEIKTVLLERFSTKQTRLYERYKFRQIKQQHESLTEFVTLIKNAAAKCEYPREFLDEILLEKFVTSIRNERIVDELLSIENITWNEAIKKAFVIEARASTKSPTVEVAYATQMSKCYRCGKPHDPKTCKYAKYVCKGCSKVGHLLVMCRNKSSVVKAKQGNKRNADANLVDLNMISSTRAPKLTKTIKINGNPIEFEIDTGASNTIVPEKYAYAFNGIKFGSCKDIIRTACGNYINVTGECLIFLNCKPLRVLFVKEKLTMPLLGRDFLDLLTPNWRKQFEQFSLNAEGCVNECSLVASKLKQKEQIVQEFRNIFVKAKGAIKNIKIDLKLKPDAKPVFAKPYELALAKREQVEQELQRMLDEGIIKSTKYSDWASPIVAVPKKDGNIRICVDFKRTVNPRVEKEQYPIPLVEEILTKIGHGKVFTVLDLQNAFLQLEVTTKASEILTINTHKGLFKFLRLPFGIVNAPAAFQAELDKILNGLSNVACYLDDIIVVGEDLQSCVLNVRKVCKRLSEYNVRVNVEKCKFFEEKVDFLGHEISSNGIKPSKSKTHDLENSKVPSNLSELRSFLGFVNYYRKFVPNMSSLLSPLYELEKKDKDFIWSHKCQSAFDKVKAIIINSDAIAPFDSLKRTTLTTDASSYGLGAVLSQEGKVIYYASRTMSEHERKLPQIQREALAIYDGVKRFHKYLYGKRFTLVTDHQPLMSIFGENKGLPKHTLNRLQHYAIFLQSYDYEIKFKNGCKIKEADLLSRLPSNVRFENDSKILSELPVKRNLNESDSEEFVLNSLSVNFKLVDIEEVAKMTEIDNDLKIVKQFIERGFPPKVNSSLKAYACKRLELECVNDCIFWNHRLVIPCSLRKKVLEILHDQHIGSTKMRLLARKEVWFPDIDKEIEKFVASCEVCQKFENKPSVNESLSSWPKARFPLDRVHIDFYTQYGKNFIIWVDSYSGYIDAEEIETKDSKSVLNYLKRRIAIFGYPHRIVSDNGPPFYSVEISEYMKAKKIDHLFAPTYHPQSNGIAERCVGIVKSGIKKIVNDSFNLDKFETLNDLLLGFLFKYRNTPCAATGKTPNESMLNFSPLTDLSTMRNLKFFIDQDVPKCNTLKFYVGEKVRVVNPNKNEGNWQIAKITKVLSKRRYEIEANSKRRIVHVGVIKKCRGGNVVASDHNYA